jgi:hypothetical protein
MDEATRSSSVADPIGRATERWRSASPAMAHARIENIESSKYPSSEVGPVGVRLSYRRPR